MLRGLLRSREMQVRPHRGPVREQGAGLAGKSGALRAAIFGINDGLVSNLSLIMGVTGANASNRIVLVAGVAGLLAGAFSMAAGEYISMRVQREVFERLIHLEAHELATEPEEEREELIGIYERKGIPRNISEEVVDALHRDPDLALETHAREELGLDPEEGLGSPVGAASSSFVMFAIGAFVPLLPFILGSGTAAAVISATVSAVVLFVVGALTSIFTGRKFLWAGTRMLLVGAVAATVVFVVGHLLHVSAS